MNDAGQVDERVRTAYHEAGHAVAAVMRGELFAVSVEPDGQRHAGFTDYAAPTLADEGFIAFAGPWAEARLQWGERELDVEDDDGFTFDDYLRAAFWFGGASDDAVLRDVHRQRAEDYVRAGIATDPDDVEAVWLRELERVRRAVRVLAVLLMTGRFTATHQRVAGLLGDAAAPTPG